MTTDLGVLDILGGPLHVTEFQHEKGPRVELATNDTSLIRLDEGSARPLAGWLHEWADRIASSSA